jgi:hypothetical protein
MGRSRPVIFIVLAHCVVQTITIYGARQSDLESFSVYVDDLILGETRYLANNGFSIVILPVRSRESRHVRRVSRILQLADTVIWSYPAANHTIVSIVRFPKGIPRLAQPDIPSPRRR